MGQIVLADLTLKIPGSPVTSQTFGVCNGREYLGANAPRVYAPRMVEFVNFRRDAISDGKTFGSTEVGGGVLRLANADGFYDDWVDYGTGGDAIFRLVDDSEADYNGAVLLLSAKVRRIEADFDEIRVHLQDRSAETDELFQTDTYAGTNSGTTGVEGLPDDLKGRPVVDGLGYVFQAPLPWANAAALILQLDSERISNIANQKIYDGLVGITRATARASLALLQAASPAAGTFDYYLGGSGDGAYVKLGSTPIYGITADFDGKAPTGTFLKRPGPLFSWVLQDRANVAYADISTDDLDELVTNAPYDLGIWVDEPKSVRDILDLIAASLPGYWYTDASGTYRIRQAKDPGAETAAFTFKVIKPTGIAKATDGDIINMERLATNDAGGGVPAWHVTVKYKRFAQVTDLEFDNAASVATRSAARSEWRTVVAEDATVKNVHALAVSLEFETALVNEADAQAVADALLDLYSVTRTRYRVTVRLTSTVAGQVDIGTVVRLEHDRFGLSAGKNFEVRGIRYRGAAENNISEALDLDVWG